MKNIRLALAADPFVSSYPRLAHNIIPADNPLLSTPTAGLCLRRAAALCACLAGLSASASALTLAWNANPEPNITRYVLGYGTSPGVYSNTLDVGTLTSATVNGLVDGTTYYFAVTAENLEGLQSAPSEEIVYHQLPAAVSLNLAWNANPETNISGYVLGYGSSPGVYTHSLDVGTSTTATVTGLTRGATYYFTVTASNQDGQQSPTATEIAYQIPAGPPAVAVLPRSGWRLHYVNSQETVGENGAAINAFDGNPQTHWVTEYKNMLPRPPHELQIDLGAVCSLQGFRYLPRQVGGSNGNIGDYEFYVSSDGQSWGQPAASGTFANSPTEQQVLFSTRNARYVRLRCLSEVSGREWSAVSELNLLGTFADGVQPGGSATFANWSASAGLIGSQAAIMATPYQDGVCNLLKYAFRLNGDGPDVKTLCPVAGTPGLPFISLDRSGEGTVLRFEYLRRKNAALIYTPLKSSDLITWHPLTAAASVSHVDSDFERVRIAEPCDPTQPGAYGRVVVEMPNSN